MSQASLKSAPLVLALLAAGVVGGAGVEALHNSRATAAPAPEAVAMALAAPSTAAPVGTIAPPDFSAITARYGPAVVNISVSGTRRGSVDESAGDAFQGGDLSEFFRRFQGQGRATPRNVPVRGQGSGFIVSADGTILTNAHVVKDASEVTVKLTARREFRAKVLGADPKTDVAVL